MDVSKNTSNKNISVVLALVAVLLLVVLVVYPLYSLLLRAFISEGKFSLQNFHKVFITKDIYVALSHSIFVSTISTVFATIIGVTLAWIVSRTDIPYRKLIKTGLIMPFLIPPFISAIAWLQLIGPAGYINSIYMAIKQTWNPLFVIYGKWAIILVMSLSGYPFVYLMTLTGLEKMNPSLEEAGQISGGGIFTVMKDITIPIMAPTIGAGAILVFVSRIANFGIPAVMGMSANYYVLTTKIYRLIDQSFIVKDAQSIAIAMSIFLILIAVCALLLVKIYLRGKEYIVISGKNVQPKFVNLGKWRYGLFAIALSMIIITVVLPIIAILLTAITRAWGLPPFISNWTLKNFRYVLFDLDMSKRAIRNSFFLAVSASIITTFIGATIAYMVVKVKVKGSQILDFISSIPYSIPGTVFALGMILAWNKSFFGRFNIYNTIWIILISYIARYLAYSVRTISSSLMQIDNSLEEAARISGSNRIQSFRDIIMPLVKPSLFASWFLVFMPAFRELTISVLLWSTGNETIGVAVFNLQKGGNVTASSALAIIMVIVIFLGNMIIKKVTKGEFGY
ncbi:MAG: iron ABC transporter permease [Candidatus Lokiarchaeota archaeon]|nr:iron ABC transporter permease [Candidatus Lokiarchaeota archaeon]